MQLHLEPPDTSSVTEPACLAPPLVLNRSRIHMLSLYAEREKVGRISRGKKHNVTDPRSKPPIVILAKFDKYTGPPFFLEPELSTVLPIFRVTRDFLYGNVACTRKQFALTVAYGITMHKSQGMTLDKAVLDISRRDFAAGMSYVAVSGV